MPPGACASNRLRPKSRLSQIRPWNWAAGLVYLTLPSYRETSDDGPQRREVAPARSAITDLEDALDDPKMPLTRDNWIALNHGPTPPSSTNARCLSRSRT